MAKLAHILLLVLLVSAYSNDTINLIRCIYKNYVPNVKQIFDIIDAIKAQNWIQVVALASSIYTKIRDIISQCKANTVKSLL